MSAELAEHTVLINQLVYKLNELRKLRAEFTELQEKFDLIQKLNTNSRSELTTLQAELTALLNKYSREQNSGTPDFILAEYIMRSLSAFEYATGARDTWYGGKR